MVVLLPETTTTIQTLFHQYQSWVDAPVFSGIFSQQFAILSFTQLQCIPRSIYCFPGLVYPQPATLEWSWLGVPHSSRITWPNHHSHFSPLWLIFAMSLLPLMYSFIIQSFQETPLIYWNIPFSFTFACTFSFTCTSPSVSGVHLCHKEINWSASILILLLNPMVNSFIKFPTMNFRSLVRTLFLPGPIRDCPTLCDIQKMCD